MKKRGKCAVCVLLSAVLCLSSPVFSAEADVPDSFCELKAELFDFRTDGFLFGENALPFAAVPDELLAECAHIVTDTNFFSRSLDNGFPFSENAVLFFAWLLNRGLPSDNYTLPENGAAELSSLAMRVRGTIAADTREAYRLAYAKAVAKTDTSAVGGVLSLDKVTNAAELSYYLLTGLFRSDKTLNMKSECLSALRLSEGCDREGTATGQYAFDTYSFLPITDTEGGVITQSEKARGEIGGGIFSPLDSLCFESQKEYGDTTDSTECHNRGFSMKAQAAFIYSSGEKMSLSVKTEGEAVIYINNRLAAAVCAGECEVCLDELAEKLEITDSEVCSLTLLYIERGAAADLSVKTNIDLQAKSYIVRLNALNGDGVRVPSGACVQSGESVSYEIELENASERPIYEISLAVGELGILLSPESVQLYDASGALMPTKAGELCVTCYAKKKKTAEIKLSGDEELKKLLADGLGAGCSMKISGFCAKSGAPHATLHSSCRLGSRDSGRLHSSVSNNTVTVKAQNTASFVLGFGEKAEYGFESILTANEMSALNAAREKGSVVKVSLASTKGLYGSAVADGEKMLVSYTPSRFMSSAEVFQLEICYYSGALLTEIQKKLRFAPAASVIYSGGFESELHYIGAWSGGECRTSVTDEKKLCGEKDSVSFSFVGTGFEVLCGKAEGVAHIYVYRNEEKAPVKALMADCAALAHEARNTPCVSVSGLERDSYTVIIKVSASGIKAVKEKSGCFRQTLTETSRTSFSVEGVRIIG